MSDPLDELIGDNDADPPKRSTTNRRPNVKAARAERGTQDAAAAAATRAEARAEQAARVGRAADQVAAATADARAAAATLQMPAEADPIAAGRSAAEKLVDRWHEALTDPVIVAALGLPVGATGVARIDQLDALVVTVTLPAHITGIRDESLDRVRLAVDARFKSGEHRVSVSPSLRGPNGELVVLIVRDNAVDSSAEYRKASPAAAAFFLDVDHAQRRCFYSAGLTITRPDPAGQAHTVAPRVLAARIGPTGPEFDVEILPGQTFEMWRAAAGKLAAMFKTPALDVVPHKHLARIRLNSRPLEFPRTVPLSPTAFVRPTTEAERAAAASHLVVPIGVTATGERITVPLARRPHFVIAGTSGAGKSTTLRMMVSALGLQGAKILLGDFKESTDMTSLANIPGVVHVATSVPTIARMIAWLGDELEWRKAVTAALAARGIDTPSWEPIVMIVDEWGAGISALIKGDTKSARELGESLLSIVKQLFAQGRSFAMHAGLSMQDTYVESLSGKIRQNASTKIVVGKPSTGSAAAHINALFEAGSEQAAALEAAKGIVDGMRGRGIVAWSDAEDSTASGVVQFQSFYNEPGSREAGAFAAALRRAPRQPRIAWKFPTDDDGAWQTWPLNPGKAGDPSLRDLPVIALDDEHGNPIPDRTRFDPLHKDYTPGTPPLNFGHDNPRGRL